MDWSTLPLPSAPDFPAALRLWCEREGRGSQTALARALGLHRVTVADWLSGSESPGPDATERLTALRTGGPSALKFLMFERLQNKFG